MIKSQPPLENQYYAHRALSTLVTYLAMLIDSSRNVGITKADLRTHIREGDVLQWLKSLDPERVDIGAFGVEGPYAVATRDWLNGLKRAAAEGDHMIKSDGLCALLVLTVERLREEVARIVDAYKKAAPAAPDENPTRSH